MNNLTSEATLESNITEYLSELGGYEIIKGKNIDRQTAIDTETILRFLQSTQANSWQKSEAIHREKTAEKLINRLLKELDNSGMLHVLRKGFTDYGVHYDMAYFKPESTLNPDTIKSYEQNILGVYPQVRYSLRNDNELDLVLGINGLPVATVELKNQTSASKNTVLDAQKQFNDDRDPNQPLFAFKKRTLVHFAVDTDEVYMTTRLDGEKTYWLPFNQGNQNGKGNPLNPDGFRTAYLWEYVWTKDSWMDIVGRFMHLEIEEKVDKATGKKYVVEKMLFPRFHQLQAVRKMIADARSTGVGKNYLIQHSAGSGKSNSISWLAYRLFSLYNHQDQKVFDNVIVITDRTVLDRQLQDNIYQFEQTSGVVQKIDKNTDQLRDALKNGTGIIITTLQKFPFVLQSIEKSLKDKETKEVDETKKRSIQNQIAQRKYALIVDEAHSSQSGEATSKGLKKILSTGAIDEEQPDYEDEIRDLMKSRGRQKNLSFFAFTATPKARTLEDFGVQGEDGKFEPFHLYSMRQAIQEGFIKDVLQGYTTYEQFYKLTKAIEDDPLFNKRKAQIAIGRFASLHPHVLHQKTEIIIEHFRQVVSKKIGGRAKAMVVTSSRLHALRYFFQFQDYIKKKNYQNIRALVAFSGEIKDAETGFADGITESKLNKYYDKVKQQFFPISERELPSKFDTDEFQILLVADKYQTGFDQPLLHTMYVDKALSGVKAVQTLSRLNRTCVGKEDTFVLDFVNRREDILASFQPYYELTNLESSTDPNLLYDIKKLLDDRQVYWASEIEGFCMAYFSKGNQYKNQGKVNSFLDPAIDRFKGLAEDEQEEFKGQLVAWTRLYSFLSQIMPFQDIELEKFFAYSKILLNKLPKKELSDRLKLSDEVALEYYRIQKIDEGNIMLEQQGDYTIKGASQVGIPVSEENQERLSQIINILNTRFSTDFTDADKLFFDQIEAELILDENLISQAKNNSMENFKYGFDETFVQKLIGRMEQNQDIFNKILDDKDFGVVVKAWMLEKVYKKINEI